MNLRLLALTVALPLAVASAGPVGHGTADGAVLHPSERIARTARTEGVGHSDRLDRLDHAGRLGRSDSPPGDRDEGSSTDPAADPSTGRSADPHGTAPRTREPSARLLGIGLATAARCGPELTSPDGIEAQTCVMTQGPETWARTYYRNATGDELSSALSLMSPNGRTVQIHCAVTAEDDPEVCETPRGRTVGKTGAYQAVVEFAAADGRGALLLRSGSNSTGRKGG